MSVTASGDAADADGEDEEGVAVDLDRRPTRTSAVASMAAGVLGMLTSAPFSGIAIPVSLLGLLFLGGGLFVLGSRRWISIGVINLFVGALIAGTVGNATPLMLLLSTVGIIVAWDTGNHAVTIGRQLGRASLTRRGELFHAASSTLVGLVAVGAVYGVFLLGTGGHPAIAAISLTFGFILLVWALRD